MGSREKRRYGRFRSLGLSCNLGEVVDLSAGGARIITHQRWPDDVDVVVGTDTLTVRLRAKVVWRQRLGIRGKMLGLSFVNLDEQTARDLSTLRRFTSSVNPDASRAARRAAQRRGGKLTLALSVIATAMFALMIFLHDPGAWIGTARGVAGSIQTLTQSDQLPQYGLMVFLGLGLVLALWLVKRGAGDLRRAGPHAVTTEIEQRRDTQALLNGILDSSLDGVMVLRAVRDELRLVQDMEVRLVNAAAEQHLGMSAEHLVGKPLRVTLPCLRQEPIYAEALGVIQTGLPLKDQRQFKHDGRWYQFALVKLGDGVSVSFRDTTEEHANAQRLAHLAHHDTLTSLPNRKLFVEHLERSLARARRFPDMRYAVLFLDFDRFKLVNDTLGHDVGDQLLVSIARRLQDNLRATDLASRFAGSTAARLGGDEFVILLDPIANEHDPVLVAQRLLDAFNQPHQLGPHSIVSRASIGIVTGKRHYQCGDEVLRDADTAMYHAKAAGKGRYVVFDEKMQQLILDRAALERDLRQAATGMTGFELHYKPVVDLGSGRIAGFEAVVRWRHETRGLMGMDELTPITDELGLTGKIGQWSLRQAATQLRQWQQCHTGGQSLFMNVTVSRGQLLDDQFPAQVRDVLAEAPVQPGSLRLQLTETMVLAHAEAPRASLGLIHELGVGLVMDGFGAGQSSLNSLRQAPIDVLKISRQFFGGADMQSKELGAILRLILELAAGLGMKVIADGIENPQQLVHLRNLSCALGQGVFFSAPLPADQAQSFLTEPRVWKVAA